MESLRKRSPVSLSGRPAQIEVRDGWEVVLSYEDQGQGPWLVDLSHRAKWDLQNGEIDGFKTWGLDVPPAPGRCLLREGLLINRMNRTQAAVWNLGRERLEEPGQAAFTETTDGLALLALLGGEALAVMERVSPLDLAAPGLPRPGLVQGPVLHVPSQVVVLGEAGGLTGLLMAFSRGYGQSVAEAILEAGHDWGLRPGGEAAFSQWLNTLAETTNS